MLKCPAEAVKANEKGIKVIDLGKCIKCGICVEVCPREYDAVVKVSPKLVEEKK